MSAQKVALEDPEVPLAGLNRSSLDRDAVVPSRLKSDQGKELCAQLRDVLRRTIVIEAISGADFTAIAGSQGAGKTTLLGMLYDLPPAILSPNAGVGEKVPLLVVDDPDAAVPTCVVRRLVDDRDGLPSRSRFPRTWSGLRRCKAPTTPRCCSCCGFWSTTSGGSVGVRPAARL